jgi:hypothetical protein
MCIGRFLWEVVVSSCSRLGALNVSCAALVVCSGESPLEGAVEEQPQQQRRCC